VFVSGITPFTREMRLVKGDFAAQMHQVMANLDAILSASGSSLARVVKCTVILARREDWRAMNEIYRTYWPGKDFPARTAFEAGLPHPDFLLEIECVAEA
jgi:enamine deaminase RidA (YjgF/YER057c/UK114 family)